MGLHINFQEHYIANNGSEYVCTSDGKTFIDYQFIQSMEFDKVFVHKLFKEHAAKFEDFMVRNGGFNFGFGSFNDILSEIGDPNFFKEIAHEVDGTVMLVESAIDPYAGNKRLSIQRYPKIFFSEH